MCLEEECRFVTGEALAPLSRRDVRILSRAVFFMVKNQLRDPHDDTFHPESIRYYRHVLDWLRVPTDNMEPHFFHTAAVVRKRTARTCTRPIRTTAAHPTRTLILSSPQPPSRARGCVHAGRGSLQYALDIPPGYPLPFCCTIRIRCRCCDPSPPLDIRV